MMKKYIITAMLSLALLVTGGVAAQASASFNNDSQDFQTVQVSDYTRDPGCSTCWSPTLTAAPGDVVSVMIYYHNTGTDAATSTVVRLNGQSQGSASYHSFSGSVGASNASTVSGSAQINLPSAQTLTYIPGTARWYPNQSASAQSLPGGQDGSELFGSGLNIGTIAADPGPVRSFAAQGSVVARFQVGSTQVNQTYACNDGIDNDGDGYTDMNDSGCTSSSDTDEYNTTNNNNGSSPDVTTQSATSVDTDQAVLNGDYDANNSSTTTWFEYARSSSDVSSGDGTVVGRESQGTGTGSMTYRLNGLRENTTYYYRAVAQNSYGTDRGSIRSFTTDQENDQSDNGNVTALTSLSSAVSQSSATVNGVIENDTGGSVTGWFQYGRTTSLGLTSATRSLGSSSSIPMAQVLSGLSSDTVYYFRAVAQASNGDISYGDILTFKTAAAQQVIYTPSPTPIVITPSVTTTSVVSTSRYVFIKIENRFENVFVGDTVNYTVTYKNISSRTLKSAVIEVAFPKEIQFVRAAQGEYDTQRNVLVINLGTLAPGDEGTIAIDAKVLSAASTKDALLTNAALKYTNPVTTVQEEAIAYVVNKVGRNSNNLGAASIFGDGGFLPTTLLGWLILILAILALVVVGRNLYNKNQMAKQPAAH
jgi:hypothetical protein